MTSRSEPEIVLLSSGHPALDHRVFYKEAVSLARRFERVRVVATHPRDEVVDGVRVTGLPPYRSRLERFLVRPLQCYAAARGPGPRVVILQDAELLVWAPLARILLRWRVIYDAHEDYARLILRRTWIPSPIRRLLSSLGALEKLLARHCDGVIAATDVLVDQFAGKRRVALYNLPTEEFVRRAGEEARPVAERTYDLVHLGTLSDERLSFLIELLKELGRRRPSTRTLVIGLKGQQAERLARSLPAAQLAVREHVDYRDIPSVLGTCRVGLDVHPILYPHLECAVPVKVFEYIAAGCGVVTSYLPELHRRLGEDGASCVITVFEPVPARYAEEIARLVDTPGLLDEHRGELLRLARERWNWSEEEKKLIRFVSEIAGAPRG